MIERWTAAGEAKSVGLLGNAADVFPELVRRGVRPDIVTDQTSAHDPVNGYLPQGWTMAEWRAKRESDPKAVATGGAGVDEGPRRGDGRVLERAVFPTLDYGNNIRQMALEEGLADAFAFPGFVPAYIRPLFCRGIGPFRWVRAVRRPRGHLPHRRQGEGADPRRSAPARLARHGARADRLPGPAGADLLGRARPAPPARARVQRDGAHGRAEGAGGDRPRPSRLRVGGVARTARPRRWRTGRTRSRTGRC